MDILYQIIQNILINILLLNHASIYIKEKIDIHDLKYIFLSTIVKSTYFVIAVTFLLYLCSCNFILFKSQIHLSLITIRNNSNTHTNLIPLINIICNLALFLIVLIVSLIIFIIMIKKNKLQVYFIMIIVSLLSLSKNDELYQLN